MEKNNIDNIKTIKDIKEIFINLCPIFYHKNNNLCILSMCFYRLKKQDNKEVYKKYITLNDDYYEFKTLLKKGIRLNIKNYTYFFNIYKCIIPLDKLSKYPPQNLIKICFENKKEIYMPVIYNLIHMQKFKGLTSKVYPIKDTDLVCYFRQANNNSIAITVREPNVTDKKINKIKIFFAKLLSLITPKKDIIFLYEKESNKYEESASVVYERLIDLNYKNVFYLINKNSNHNSFIKEKYQKNIIHTHTFKHYYYFFKCHKFIGTESIPHSIELRAADKYITKKYIKKNYQQVFLQHGVMYMISMDAKTRSGLRKNGNEMPIDAKVVVSSEKEAQHLIDLGGFNKEDLYKTGLPFYDRTIKKENADKIVIMFTWRQWDYNLLITNYKEASYYKIIKKVINNIPKKYHDKLILLPHPLILNKFKNIDLNKWIPDIKSYDKILEDTALLITDYSSIAYSAFYRGSNVIFCWDELEECMEKVGGHLMLNEDNVFGDITYNCENIGSLIEKNYLKNQNKKYQKNYQEIVEFKDNKNTDRLIEKLKNDNFI